MKQRVNLQYSIDIEELPSETHRLVTGAHESLTNAIEQIKVIVEQDSSCLTVDCLDKIDSVRMSMMNADYVLSDIQNIIKGYLNYVSGESETDSGQVDSPAPDMANMQDLFGSPNLDELQEKLNNFQQSIESQQDATTTQELPK